MKKIKLSQGKYALVDNEDYEKLSKYKWYSQKNRLTWYTTRWIKKDGKWKQIQMHRQIMKTPKGMVTDHIDHNGLNNQKKNLRICTVQQNNCNNLQKAGKSGVRGVYWYKRYNNWHVQITINGKRTHIGYYDDINEAAKEWNRVAKKYNGEFAILNKVN
jgi:hypothetical protein